MQLALPPVRRTPAEDTGGSHRSAGHGNDPGPIETLAWDHFSAEVTDLGSPVVVRCRGGLDFAYAEQLREVFAGIGARDVIVDLRRLTFLDRTGLSALLSARRTLENAGGAMSIRGASGSVRRVFEVAGIAGLLDDEPKPLGSPTAAM
jgi:anti-anti-sigma factor